MMKNTKILFSIFFIFLFFVSISLVNATAENDTQSLSEVNQLKNELNTGESYQTTENTHVLNTSSFKEYVTDGKFNEKVSEGDTIDIQGKLDSPKFAINITKPVNIISSTNDAYIDLDTRSLGTNGEYTKGMFQISEGSAGTNITGITFHNTRVWVYNTFDVHIDNITVLCEQNTGSGVGSFSIRANSHDVTVTNSYFKTIHNGGHSNVVVAGASNCLFENNTVFADAREGNVGNVFYLTTYGGSTNTNITIRNNTIRSVFSDNQGLAICMGLVLEGTGHLIENNYINALSAVGPQWADENYGVRTDIDNVTFRNNYVTGGANLIFNGSFYNNTLDCIAHFSHNIAYNNTIEKNVFINDNVIFENNTAKKITVEGSNNTLNNNVIYSDEDYAVTIKDENNTLTNNKLLSNLGYGEDAISNSTEYVSINNSEKMPRIFYINEDNILDYFDIYMYYSEYEIYYQLKDNSPINQGDIICFNLNPKLAQFRSLSGVIIKDSLLDNVWGDVFVTDDNTLINSTSHVYKFTDTIVEDYSTYPKNNTYILCSYTNFYESDLYGTTTRGQRYNIFDENGHIKSDIDSNSKILVIAFDDSNYGWYMDWYGESPIYKDEIFIDKSLDFISVDTKNRGHISSKVHVTDGSIGSNFTGITFDGDVLVESDNINFINCTFNSGLTVTGSYVNIDGCKLNGKILLNSTSTVIFNNTLINSTDEISVVKSRNIMFENNSMTTTDVNTIVFDDDSANNVVRNNYLVAASLIGDDSVIVGDNIVEDNNPAYDTQIVIDSDSQAYVDEGLDVTITVNDLNNNPVSKGYVEVYFDGYLIDIKDLTNGATSLNIPVVYYVDGSESYPVKVWYYDGKHYENSISTKSVRTVKSNVSITLDEFTAKLNEKATITATFQNQNSNLVLDNNVTFMVGRSTFIVETVGGVATLSELVTKEWLDAAKITISFPNGDAYNYNTTTIVLNTSKDDVLVSPTVSVMGNTASIVLNYSDSLNNPLGDGKVSINTIDGTQLASGRVNNGVYTATVTIPENYESEYLVANYTGSYYYNDLARNIKLSLMLNSTITIETNSPVYGEELVLNGKLEDSKGNSIGNNNVTLSLNGTKAVVTTDSNGNYTYTYIPELGVNTITATFNGNEDVYGCSASKNITIRDTTHEINDLLNQIEELTAENNALKDELANASNVIAEQNATINDLNNTIQEQTNTINTLNNTVQDQANTIDDLNDTIQEQNTTIENLTATVEEQANTINTLNDTVNDLNNTVQDQATTINDLNNTVEQQNAVIDELQEEIRELKAPKNTTITFDEITARYNEEVTISGTLVNEDSIGLFNQEVTLTIGESEVNVTTKGGVFEYTTTFKELGEKTVTASYAGNDKYQASDATTTFNVEKQDIIITYDTIQDIQYKDNVTITGKVTDVNGKALYNINAIITINGKVYKAKTDKTGAFTFTLAASTVGLNNVTLSYGGNANYNGYETSTTFNVGKQDIVISYDAIADTQYKDNVIITGKVTDVNGKALYNINALITINGKLYKAKTDSTGAFTLTVAATNIGTNNVTIGYGGNANYNSYETSTTFNVDKQNITILYDSIVDTVCGDDVTISGNVADVTGKSLNNINVLIHINGKLYKAKTDSTGAYTLTTTATTAGTNNVTISYGGNAYYNSYETSTTFNVIAKAE